jgi:ribose-phosphate pyrophosphokinase
MITYKAQTASGEIIKSALSPFSFPAGEAHIKREEQRELEPTEIAIIQSDANSIHDDLFQLAMWNETVVDELGYQTKRVLVLPYVPGARADRGTPWGLDVYSSFINRMELDQIIVFDPHSEVTEELLGDEKWSGEHTLTVVHSDELFDQVHMRAVLNQYDGIIAPDKGAVKRATAMANLAKLPVFTATKHRDEGSGKLSGFAIDGLHSEGTYLIVDDICDGGGTFLGLAEASGLGWGQLDLYVSHGVFSKEALTNLSERFEYVYTTNSYAPTRELNTNGDITHDTFRRFDVIRLLLSKIK